MRETVLVDIPEHGCIKYLEGDAFKTTWPGSIFVIYSDDGPGGPCGQGGDTIIPHTYLHIFDSTSHFRHWLQENDAKSLGRNGHRYKVRVISPGEFDGGVRIIKH